MAQTRAPSTLVIDGLTALTLPGPNVRDTGDELFHLATSSGLACATCHPEGGDDGHVWNLAGAGPRRTQSLRGGIAQTEPLHWQGDLVAFQALTHDVMRLGMRGPELSESQANALERFINDIPPWQPAPPGETAAVQRGRELFEGTATGCSSCHSGPLLTNNETVDVGTGGKFQVPSLLGVSRRAPFMHDGCAPTLAARFGACGGGDKHGTTSTLSPSELDELVAYMNSL